MVESIRSRASSSVGPFQTRRLISTMIAMPTQKITPVAACASIGMRPQRPVS